MLIPRSRSPIPQPLHRRSSPITHIGTFFSDPTVGTFFFVFDLPDIQSIEEIWALGTAILGNGALMSEHPLTPDDETPADREHAAAGSAGHDKSTVTPEGPNISAVMNEGVPADGVQDPAAASNEGADESRAEGADEETIEPFAEATNDEATKEDAFASPKSQHVAHEQLVIDPTLLAESEEPFDVTVLENVTLAIAPHDGPEPRGDSEIFLPHDLIAFSPTAFARPSHAGRGHDSEAARGGNGGGGQRGGNKNDDTGADGPEVLSSYTSGGAAESSYNITIKFKGGDWTGELQQAFIDASNWISGTIEADVIDAFFRGKVIDDIEIDATVKAIDGTGGVLGQAGPTAVRQVEYDYLPAKAVMTFDTADAQDLLSGSLAGHWGAVVLHEMLHSVGIGTIWDLQGLVSGTGTSTPTFTGDYAVLAYHELFGGSGGVPLESGYGPGTDESHWDEYLFGNELMTGFLDIGNNYISGMTVASLVDIGYVVDGGSYDQKVEYVV
jgi:hypothetical protein